MSAEIFLVVSHRSPRDSIGGTEMLANATARALRVRGHDVVWLSVAEPNAPEIQRHRGGELEEWQISPCMDDQLLRDWRAMEVEQARKVAACLDHYLGQRHVAAIHLLHFARIGLTFLQLPALAECAWAATLTDYSAICPDHQLRNRVTGTVCSGRVPARSCRSCLRAAGGAVPGAASIASWRARNLAALSNCRGLFVQTPHQRMVLVENGFPDRRFVQDLAAYPVPRHWPRRERRDREEHRFLFVGRASAEKGLDVALQAFASRRASPEGQLDRLIVAVPDPERARAGHAALGGLIGVEWTGPIDFGDLGALIASCDTLLVPSLWLENHPMVLTYALELGLGALCSDVGSLRHLASAGQVELVAVGDVPAWTRAMAGAARAKEGSLHATALPSFEALMDRVELTVGGGR